MKANTARSIQDSIGKRVIQNNFSYVVDSIFIIGSTLKYTILQRLQYLQIYYYKATNE